MGGLSEVAAIRSEWLVTVELITFRVAALLLEGSFILLEERILRVAAIKGLPNVLSEFYSVVLDCCDPQEKIFSVFCNPFHATVFLLSSLCFLLLLFHTGGRSH